jgi:hypothetical protein
VQLRMSSIIHITTWIFQFPIVSRELPRYGNCNGKYKCKASLELEHGRVLDWEFESISNDLFERFQECTGLFLDRPGGDTDADAIVMVLIRKGDVYERIGLGIIPHSARIEYNAEGRAVHHHCNSSPYYPPTLKSKSWKEIRLG